ncbi:hypothetical protein AC249_AIPGENE14738 [Exaiptasia diaphana]|nr:hypothetical protein AC249_AIPGENE14738 [Exaiptasia diaphana]
MLTTRRQILSILADKVGFKDLKMWIPQLTRYRFNIARQHILLHGRGSVIETTKNTRICISPQKLDHFLTFITSSSVVQDLPFGERSLTLSFNKKITVPNVISTLVPEQIVQQYQSYCEESDFTPLSRSTLCRILKVCSASVRKSLQGLDYISAEGAKSFDDVEDIVAKLGDEHGMGHTWAKDQGDKLKMAKRYLKGDYKVHVAESSRVADHCRVYALSHKTRKDTDHYVKCNHEHDLECDRCKLIPAVFEAIDTALTTATISNEEKEEMSYLVAQSKKCIEAWKAHLLRSVNQDEARLDTIRNLDTKSVLIILDWATKFLPRKYRESQSDWFGKRGISWHIAVVTRKLESTIETLTFVHIFRKCSQDSPTVVAVVEDVVRQLKIIMPAMENAPKWDGISFINNFEYQNDGIRTWREYAIGPGKFLEWSSFNMAKTYSIPQLNIAKETAFPSTTFVVQIASSVQRLYQPKQQQPDKDESSDSVVINDVTIQDPYTLDVKSDFSNSPPFGLYDIFNFLIYNTTTYDKQGLAAYKSFEDYRLFYDGHVESLLCCSIQGLFVYRAKLYKVPDEKLSDVNVSDVGVMKKKIAEVIENGRCSSNDPQSIFNQLSFSEEEIDGVNKETLLQWQCDEWFLHKTGFISASKCYRVAARRETTDPTNLVNAILSADTTTRHNKLPVNTDPMDPRTWGLVHEQTARKAYRHVQNQLHHKLELIPTGFMISKEKQFLGASLDDIQQCQCNSGCPDIVVEYKCPWKHKDVHPKEAFVSKEIGGVREGDKFLLKSSCPYYYQVQQQMLVSQLQMCNFVVWTKLGIFTVQVPYDSSFMSGVCLKLEQFWLQHILPPMVKEVLKSMEKQDSSNNGGTASDLPTAPLECCALQSALTTDPHICTSPEETTETPTIEVVSNDTEIMTANTLSASCMVHGLQLHKIDVQTTEPGNMINDRIVEFLLKELHCPYPIISLFFYTALCGEQNVKKKTTRSTRIKSAAQFYKSHLLDSNYVFIPINRRHILLFDSLTWNKKSRRKEFSELTR